MASSGEQGLLEGGQDQGGGLGRRHPPAQDPPRVHVGHEADIDEPGQRPYVGEVGHPPLVGSGRGVPVPFDQVGMAGGPEVADGGLGLVLSPAHPLDAEDLPSAGRPGPGRRRDRRRARRSTASRPHTGRGSPSTGPTAGWPYGRRPSRPGTRTRSLVGVIGARGDRHVVPTEHPADRLDPEAIPIGVDVGDDQRSLRSSSAAAKNAEAVFRISFARRSSAFSRRSSFNSADDVRGTPGRLPASISTYARSSPAWSPASRRAAPRPACGPEAADSPGKSRRRS